MLRVPVGTLGTWNQGFDEQMNSYQVVDRRRQIRQSYSGSRPSGGRQCQRIQSPRQTPADPEIHLASQ